jgi:bla regulator protein BlaR1
MILYILKSATCLALLLAFYHLVLEREKMHNFNRFYLLGSVLFSFLVPLYIIYIDVAPLVLKATPTTSFSYPTEITPEIIIEKSIDYTLIFIGIYSLISSILFIRFGKNLFHIIQKIRKNKQVKYQKAVLVLVDDAILPHTFWNYIFINKNDFENQKIEQELFTHELTHVTQKHTLDVLFLEFLQAIFWINPFFILLKKAVQLNHEFLADETVINQHKNTIQYQHLLLNKAAWKNDYYLASNLNYSLTKKRLKMMTTQSSQTKIWIKKLAVIPLLAGFIFLFAERVEAQEIIEVKKYIDTPINDLQIEDLDPEDIRVKLKDINSLQITYLDKDTIIEKSIASEKQMNEYKLLLNEGKKHNIYKLKNIKKMQTIYSLMSKKQKNSVQNISKIIPPPPPPIAKVSKQKTSKLNQSLKIIDNQKDFLTKYNYLNNLYEDFRTKKPHFIKSSLEKQNELNEMFSFLGSCYFELSKDDKEKAKRPIHPYDPYLKLRKNNKVFYKLRKDLTEEDKLLIPPPPPVPNATKEEIEKAKNAYEAWKKRTGNDFTPPPPPPVKKKQEAPEEIKVEEKSIADFNIEFEKSDNLIKMKCLKGCEWKKLNFDLKLNTPQIVNKYGLNKVNQRNKDDSFYFVLLQDEEIFDMKSTKNTKWKGLSGSSKEKMKLLINKNKVKSII